MNEVLKNIETIKKQLTEEQGKSKERTLQYKLVGFAIRNVNRLEKVIRRIDRVIQEEDKRKAAKEKRV